MMSIHKDLAEGKWQQISLAMQMGNIGSEVYRAARSFNKDQKHFDSAVTRGLELFDLTLSDLRWRGRLLELGRAREFFCDAILGGKEYGTTFQSIQSYYDEFAVLANKELFS
ncbi:MAG: hypothetical protein A2941_01495 [Candidatus Yanofskybacteria bacterium RIFCSPLOWO2_01_FULL_49_17]|uniref:Uncharacterized protein n=1 Tax=Candidatus Yanofskybacteria bacterium RIFCSPLOWO2_01_FULL_49_17 TaxID=1802700 RepID=A0A1F8GQH0_9BACT|nr:MAG: hypothetical protein A2941_01495 [Candidatus Yanofskybacteria bacterium RIFCSPLOWO2_01_FULL_49_17]